MRGFQNGELGTQDLQLLVRSDTVSRNPLDPMHVQFMRIQTSGVLRHSKGRAKAWELWGTESSKVWQAISFQTGFLI
ncbi:TPA: hypothetical protein DCW61_04040 [Candidatus Uhrbacteria bacterium]|nr:hypothetical protein [Candidatus Uhrbacteria bacterium]